MALRTVKDANKRRNLLEPLHAFRAFSGKGVELEVKLVSSELELDTVPKQAHQLTKTNMQGMYNRCPGWGWSDSKKLRELQHFSARILYCVAAGSENAVQPGRQSLSAAPRRKGSTVRLPFPKIVAFLHFRFEVEGGEPTLYIYDIQLAETAQKVGLGKFLMQLAELIAWRNGMTQVMLTVFHANLAGIAFYSKLGYKESVDSPGSDTDAGYAILHKRIPTSARNG